MQNNYTVINASAGSGKTYALVQKLIIVCLRYPNQHTEIGKILALTFTNKAANEMKERIITWLGNFSKTDYETNSDLINIQKELENVGLKVTLSDLHIRSKKLLDYILHHYSTLNIGTIDKFNSRLVRNFSYELDLAKNFNLEINAEPFLIEAIDQLLEKIGEDQEISKTLLDYTNYNLDNEKRVDIHKSLYKSAKEFIGDIHYDNLTRNSTFTSEKYNEATQILRTKLAKLRQESKKLAEDALKLILDNNLEASDFAGGEKMGIGLFFNHTLKGTVPLRKSHIEEQNFLARYKKGSSAKGKKKETLIFQILDDLLDKRQQIIQNEIQIVKTKKILDTLLPLKVNRDIQNELSAIEIENDLVLLSKFNILIHENLKNEPSEFIYEKIGNQFQHFFFDEFQDTSVMQWKNFLPLRDNSLSSEGTSFTLVGDPKQSIYRFRGGESQLMLDIINKTEISPKHADLIILEDNWRSAKNIVDFNNRLYEYLSFNLKPEHQEIFGENAFQNAKSENNGRVKIHLIEKNKKEIFLEDVSHKMALDIQECINNGYSFSDITILCEKKDEIRYYVKSLSSKKITQNGEEIPIKILAENGLTLDISHTINAVIQFLRWELSPQNHQFLFFMFYHLQELGKIENVDFTKEIHDIIHKSTPQQIQIKTFEKYNINLDYNANSKLNLYNYIEYFLQEFSVEDKENEFILTFLETVYNYSQKNGATLKDFIKYWDEEANTISIQSSENINAITLMTIHKSKGLEFPIVLYPLTNDISEKYIYNWFDTKNVDGLSSTYLSNFKDEHATYDEEISVFNEENSYRNYIDQLCKQYVATTRPVDQLFLYIQEKENSNYSTIYDFVSQKKEESKEFDYFKVNHNDLQKNSSKNKNTYLTESVEFSKSKSNPSYAIATPSKNYQERNEKVRMGIFIHEIFSQITTKEDIDTTLEKYRINGFITQEEEKYLLDKIYKIVSDYAQYFEGEIHVHTERELMIKENNSIQIIRPDRLIETPEGFYIIDFKTGAENKKHEDQVKLYRKALEDIGKKVIDTVLIYL